MEISALKRAVFEANLDLPMYGLVTFTWGNVSAIDRDRGIVAIKPSGVPYNKLKIGDIVIMNLDGKVMEGFLKPSSDASTHLVIYRNFKEVGGVVHTHSPWAVSWAQSGRGIPCFGTTHADYFYGEVPCTRPMTNKEITGDYETGTGNVIIETFKNRNPMNMPGVLINGHGPFCWGNDCRDAVHNAVVLENIAMMAYHTVMLTPEIKPVDSALLDKHYLRKHGLSAYYGQ